MNDYMRIRKTSLTLSKYKRSRPDSGSNFEPKVDSCLCLLLILKINFKYFFIGRYPTRSQYTTIVIGIMKHLGIEYDAKNAVSE